MTPAKTVTLWTSLISWKMQHSSTTQ